MNCKNLLDVAGRMLHTEFCYGSGEPYWPLQGTPYILLFYLQYLFFGISNRRHMKACTYQNERAETSTFNRQNFNMNWGHFIERIRDSFYTMPFMQLMSLVVIIFYFSTKTKTKSLAYLVIIAIASLTEGLLADYHDLNPGNSVISGIGVIFAPIYLNIEVIFCLLFIKAHIRSQLAKKVMLIIPILFVGCFIILIIIGILSHHPANKPHANGAGTLSLIYTIEGFLIATSCLYFFYELFVHDPIKTNFNISAIWAIAGMLILFGTIAPFYLFAGYLFNNNRAMLHNLWPINYIAYSLLFITFAIAIFYDQKHSKPL